ncbi:Protease 4 [Rubrivivax sp. A210]|uniref:signal peptide peptidase SppA n=1 Tax=Rubrivivax sp. A210 TaxID=2772301 RepID=UPI00191A27C1|nr:signal peptide peptidase SppA [Rubrivivax sp. A210]CAD5372467.1 Protease 4 [Rubrivivax sp. A210]
MPSKTLSAAVTALRRLWWLLDASRRALLNLLLLLLVGGLLWAWLGSGPAGLEPKTALVIAINGSITEQASGGGRDSLLRQVDQRQGGQTRLRDIVAVLDAAAKDEKITHAVLMLDGLTGAGLPTLREVAAALLRFKAAGKPVQAWGSEFDQRQYYLAAHASEVWLHPMGAVVIEGYGRWRSYYKDLLDRAGVSANVIRVGKFKNAAETFAANAPSPETQESDAALYGGLWASYTAAVEGARKLPAGSIAQAIESLPASLQTAQGDIGRWALERKWVDALKTRDELRAAMIERGARDEENKTFRQISLADYLGHLKPRQDGDAVGVIVAQGTISDGQAPAGSIGGLSTAELIRKAREDDKIKALVLRVDSPGGSAFGSELVRRELELARKAGKPVVVSMGDVAASGGYWISMAADEVIADEATITGSIGVIALLPTAASAMDKLGVRTGGAGTTWLASGYDLRRDTDPRFTQLIQTAIAHVYRDFTVRVAAARKSTPEKIDAVAQGRVWIGKDALAQGLVDRLGGLDEALKSATTRAKLPEGSRIQYIEAEGSRFDRLLRRFGAATGLDLGGLQAGWRQALLGPAAAVAGPVVDATARDLGLLAELTQGRRPFSAVVHCLCTAP